MMSRRESTLAERRDRHLNAGWTPEKNPPGLWKPSHGYIPRPVRDGWTAAQLVVAVLLGSAAVVGLALAIGGAA